MKLGVLTVALYDRSLENAFAFLREKGVDTVEIGTGGFPGKTHCDPAVLLESEAKLNEFKALLAQYDMHISALSCHSNHVHPQKEVREVAAQDFSLTLRLAEKLGVDTVVTFSGCPGDAPGATYPNWVTCSWPNDYPQILEYQWNDVLIPFWQEAAKQAQSHGVNKIALEMHPGFCVYNTASMLRLREAVGDVIGANFDPSHLYWQGMQPAEAIKALGSAIHHFHAKDTGMNPFNTAVNGVLETGSLANPADRAWNFRAVGWGHDAKEWKDILTALRLAGYDGAISIEHEEALMSGQEGLEKAIDFLQPIIIRDPMGEVWWA